MILRTQTNKQNKSPWCSSNEGSIEKTVVEPYHLPCPPNSSLVRPKGRIVTVNDRRTGLNVVYYSGDLDPKTETVYRHYYGTSLNTLNSSTYIFHGPSIIWRHTLSVIIKY